MVKLEITLLPKMKHAYPQVEDFAFRNVKKCYPVIIDNPGDPKIILNKPNSSSFEPRSCNLLKTRVWLMAGDPSTTTYGYLKTCKIS